MARKQKKPNVETIAAQLIDSTQELGETTDVKPSAGATATTVGTEGDRVTEFGQPFNIAHHNVAGVELRKHPRFKQYQFHFRNPVPHEVDQMLKDNGWVFRPTEEVYTKQWGEGGPGVSYVESSRLYKDICEQLAPEQAKGRF